MKRYLALALAATLGTSLAACSSGHVSTLPTASTSSLSASSHQRVRHLMKDRSTKDFLGGVLSLTLGLLDAPLLGDPNAVFNVGILGVDAIDSNGDSWQLIANQSAQVVNLMSLQSNALNLGTGSLPPGNYTSIQLLLDPSTVNATIFGQNYPAHFASLDYPWWDSTQTIEAVTIPLNVSGSAGQSIAATLDFNVFQSANLQNGVVNVNPTVVAGIGSPAIAGTVLNNAGQPVSSATVIATDANGNVANVSATGADGTFVIHGISAGSYTVSVANNYTTAAGATVTASGADAGAAPSTYVVVGTSGSINVGTLND